MIQATLSLTYTKDSPHRYSPLLQYKHLQIFVKILDTSTQNSSSWSLFPSTGIMLGVCVVYKGLGEGIGEVRLNVLAFLVFIWCQDFLFDFFRYFNNSLPGFTLLSTLITWMLIISSSNLMFSIIITTVVFSLVFLYKCVLVCFTNAEVTSMENCAKLHFPTCLCHKFMLGLRITVGELRDTLVFCIYFGSSSSSVQRDQITTKLH